MSWALKEIGEVAGTVGNVPPSGYIRLMAGCASGYNAGLIRDETVSGSWPNITATATINGGTLDGVTVDLIDTSSPSSIAHFVKVI